MFTVYEEEIEELDMEIGLPTDVKHVTHIGWDASYNDRMHLKWTIFTVVNSL